MKTVIPINYPEQYSNFHLFRRDKSISWDEYEKFFLKTHDFVARSSKNYYIYDEDVITLLTYLSFYE